MTSTLKEACAEISTMDLEQNGKIAFSVIRDTAADIKVDIYIPLNKAPETSIKNYILKSKVYLTNAIKTRHEGDLFSIQNSIRHLEQYIEKKNLKQITNNYNMIMLGLDDKADSQNSIVDIYIGVSSNVL
jgi:effector-binding domain-containing protein